MREVVMLNIIGNNEPKFIPLNKNEAPVNKDLLRTYVAIVLDKSGSMQTILDATINGFNSQVDSIVKEAVGKVFLSLVTFNTFVEPVFWNQHPSYLTKLSRENYRPYGWTALYDAVGYTINRLEYTAEDVGNSAFLVIIVSDGEENSSQQFKYNLPGIIKQKQQTGRWTFVYVGSGHDIAKAASTLSISANNSLAFTNDWHGTVNAFSTTSGGIGTYFAAREKGLTSSSNFYSGQSTSADKLDTLINNAQQTIVNVNVAEKVMSNTLDHLVDTDSTTP
jgi:hypothetical protein